MWMMVATGFYNLSNFSAVCSVIIIKRFAVFYVRHDSITISANKHNRNISLYELGQISIRFVLVIPLCFPSNHPSREPRHAICVLRVFFFYSSNLAFEVGYKRSDHGFYFLKIFKTLTITGLKTTLDANSNKKLPPASPKNI